MGDVDPPWNWVQDEGRVQPSIWRVEELYEPCSFLGGEGCQPQVSPPPSHPKILGISPPAGLPPALPILPCWRCHRATPSLHPDVPKGWGQGSGQGHGVPGLTEHLRQPLARSTEEGAAREEYF